MSEPLSCTESGYRNRDYTLGDDDTSNQSPIDGAGGRNDAARASIMPDPATQVCESREPQPAPERDESVPPAGSQVLVAKFKPKPAAVIPPNRSNAVRTAERPMQQLVAESSSGPQGHTGEVALLKGTEQGSGFGLEAGSASYHFAGDGMELDAAGYRAKVPLGPGELDVEADTFHAYVGRHGPDGSQGMAFEFSATAIGAEATLEHDGEGVTLGPSRGLALGASVGLRDQDQDGTVEVCARVMGAPGVVGVCTEGIESVGPDPTPSDGASGTGSADAARSSAHGPRI